MITPEKVYEVFGIDAELKFMVGDECTDNIMCLIKVAPEILAALIEIIIDTEQHYKATEDPLQDERFEDDYGHVIKLIEKADYKNRTWLELKKELLK